MGASSVRWGGLWLWSLVGEPQTGAGYRFFGGGGRGQGDGRGDLTQIGVGVAIRVGVLVVFDYFAKTDK